MLEIPTIDTRWVAPWQPDFVGTLVFVVQRGSVLLIHKKTGHGQGKINGPGGKVDPGESLRQCALREVQEEVGLKVADVACGAELRFVEKNGPQWLGYAFTATGYQGSPRESREARPFWTALDQIPFDQMWPDDRIWLPRVLQGVSQAPTPNSTAPLVMDLLFEQGRLLDHHEIKDGQMTLSVDWQFKAA